jgi:hypothetical protein
MGGGWVEVVEVGGGWGGGTRKAEGIEAHGGAAEKEPIA